MKLRALSACVAVLVFAVACANTAQQPETQPAVVPTPSMEPLDGDSFVVTHLSVLLPGGIISEELQSILWELEGTFNGKHLPHPYSLECRYDFSEYYNSPIIHVVQEIFFPEEAHIRVHGLAGGPRYIPHIGVTPKPFDYSFPLDIPFGANSARIIYKGEWAWLAGYIGRFRVGEEQTDVFWFLFQQLGKERAIIADSETYEAYWGGKRTEWINNPIPTSDLPDTTTAKPTPTTLPPIPPTTELVYPPVTPPDYIPTRESE